MLLQFAPDFTGEMMVDSFVDRYFYKRVSRTLPEGLTSNALFTEEYGSAGNSPLDRKNKPISPTREHVPRT